jgi:hypothetical protein
MWHEYIWGTIHCIALAYYLTPTDENKENCKRFYESLSDLMPCRECGMHYKMLLEQHPVDVKNSECLFAWTVKIHNLINLKLKKPQMSVEDAKKIWEMKARRKQ